MLAAYAAVELRGVFAVGDLGEPKGQRWELALDLLRRGEAFSIGHVTFRRTGPETVEVAVASDWPIGQVNERRARDDLEQARSWVEELISSDEAFRAVVADSSMDYVLVDEIGATPLYRLVGESIQRLLV